MNGITCDWCGSPAVWRVIADAARSGETTSRYVCMDERHLISARETLGPCSVVEIDEQPGLGWPR